MISSPWWCSWLDHLTKNSASGNYVLLDRITVEQRFEFWFPLCYSLAEGLRVSVAIFTCAYVYIHVLWIERGQRSNHGCQNSGVIPLFLRQSFSRGLAYAARVRLAGTWAPGIFPAISLALVLQAWTSMPAFPLVSGCNPGPHIYLARTL